MLDLPCGAHFLGKGSLSSRMAEWDATSGMPIGPESLKH